MLGLYPGHDWDMLTNDAVTAVELVHGQPARSGRTGCDERPGLTDIERMQG